MRVPEKVIKDGKVAVLASVPGGLRGLTTNTVIFFYSTVASSRQR
jgi:hypothetical protein